MAWHLYVVTNADKYVQLEAHSKVSGVQKWTSGDPLRDWHDYREWGKQGGHLVIAGSSVTAFLHDVPGYMLVENYHGNEVLVRDSRDPVEISPRDFDTSIGVAAGFTATGWGSDGWAQGWNRGPYFMWRAIDSPRGVRYRSAVLSFGVYRDHEWHDTINEAADRLLNLEKEAQE